MIPLDHHLKKRKTTCISSTVVRIHTTHAHELQTKKPPSLLQTETETLIYKNTQKEDQTMDPKGIEK